MGAKFCFFTDPAKLKTQQTSEAFGPMPAADGNDRYRVTDLHTAAGTAPVVAICDGLLCAQWDASGTLSLILKPIEQPPFDIPAIAYVIYKGVDPASLLAGAFVDVSKADDNDLVRQVEAAWLAPVNANSGDPPGRCLGLHLTPASNAADFPDLDLSEYADSEPLDRLFYQGDAKFQFPLVRGGWRLGDFAAAGPFGLEIVLETMAYSPPIALARRVENRIEVPSLDPDLAYEPSDAAYFMHWHSKEEALNFIDPCAFWGCFYDRKLRVVDASGGMTRKKGNAIYQDLLRGPHDDLTATAGHFLNRNRIYLDIRNEHNRSFNYYKINGSEIFITFDASAAIDTCPQLYNRHGWPIFAFDQALLGTAAPPGPGRLRIAFSANNYRLLQVYKPPERLSGSMTATSLQHLELDLSGSAISPAVIIRVPFDNSGPSRTISRYVTLFTRFDEQITPAHRYGTTRGFPWEPPRGIPLQGFGIPFAASTSASLKTFSDRYILRLPYESDDAVLYNPGWMIAQGETALFLTPTGPLTKEVGPISPSHAARLHGGGLSEAVSRLARPRIPVARQTASGLPYHDFSFSETDDPISRASWDQVMLFLAPQILQAARQAKTAAVAALAIAPAETMAPTPGLVLELRGLKAESGEMVPFVEILDTGAVSNADAH